MASHDHIPITVLTGFLGSGKTTLLNALLRQPAMATALVVINEFGEIALDHDLIESVHENTVVLQSGCICCTVRNDLIATLQDAFSRRERGEITAFDRVVIETTGLADPAPILQTLMTDVAMTKHFRLDGVISTVDAVAGQSTLDRYMEAVKQAAVADRIILTKADLATADDCAAMETRLRALNPAAAIVRAAKGAVDPDRLFNVGLYDVGSKSIDVQRWLNAETYATAHHHRHAGHHHDAEASLQPSQDINRHDEQIHAVCLTLDQPIRGEALDLWLQSLLRIKGPRLLRFKAIVHVAELPGPVVVQGVQHVIYPPAVLPRWPSEDRRTRMVFITDGIDEQTIRSSLEEFTNEAASVTG